MSIPVLTIDGPSGAGKGTVSRAVAKKLGWNYLDSGAIYRALAIAVSNQRTSLDDVIEITNIAKQMQLAFECNEELTVLLDGEDISSHLISEKTGSVASKIAALPEVRKVLLQKQRDFQQQPGLVADGRDMGTVVFLDAPYKVFLSAGAVTRAKRRYKQLIEKGIDANLTRIIQDIEERDQRDSERSVAPLKMATDAHYIDTSEKSIAAVIAEVLDFID